MGRPCPRLVSTGRGRTELDGPVAIRQRSLVPPLAGLEVATRHIGRCSRGVEPNRRIVVGQRRRRIPSCVQRVGARDVEASAVRTQPDRLAEVACSGRGLAGFAIGGGTQRVEGGPLRTELDRFRQIDDGRLIAPGLDIHAATRHQTRRPSRVPQRSRGRSRLWRPPDRRSSPPPWPARAGQEAHPESAPVLPSGRRCLRHSARSWSARSRAPSGSEHDPLPPAVARASGCRLRAPRPCRHCGRGNPGWPWSPCRGSCRNPPA